MIITFGKWRGSGIDAIPTDYLEWLLEVLEDDEKFNRKYPGLDDAVVDELAIRERSHAHFYTRDL